MCNPSYIVWEGCQPGDWGRERPGAWSGRGCDPGDCGCLTLGTQTWKWGHPRNSGCLTPLPGSGSWGGPRDSVTYLPRCGFCEVWSCWHCVLVTLGTGSWICLHPREYAHVTPYTGFWRVFTLRTVDMWSQVQCLEDGVMLETMDMWPMVQGAGGGVTLETVDM